MDPRIAVAEPESDIICNQGDLLCAVCSRNIADNLRIIDRVYRGCPYCRAIIKKVSDICNYILPVKIDILIAGVSQQICVCTGNMNEADLS